MTFKMRRLLLLMILVQLPACWNGTQAQDLKFRIAEFYQDQQDLTAQEENREDGDGTPYAIIKVTSDNEDDDLSLFSFDFNNQRSTREMRDGELWLFVQRNAKYVTIRREGYRTLKNAALGLTLQAGKTYRMKLSTQERIIQRRILQFKVTPANEKAIVKVKVEDSNEDYQLWGAVDANGSIDRLLETGAYVYEIVADGYEPSLGKVMLANGNHVENVALTPNFGFLEITDASGIAGAEVYINNRKVGTIPYKSGRMECRNDYQLMISHGELYKTYNSTIEIRRGETTTISPRLQSNFAETTIKVEDEAEIVINGISKGKGSWKGPLCAGVHDVECRLPNHISSKKQIVVKVDVPETHILDKPTPIEGSLYVKSNPSGAKIFIDGRELGIVTPNKIDNVLIGSHKVTILFDDNKLHDVDIHINKDEIATVDVNLSDINPTGRIFTIGGVTFKMKLVEAGTFQMGSTTGGSDEAPVYSVTISKDYYLGETEVTQALWKAVTGYSPTSGGLSWSSKYGLGDNYPAYFICYEDVQSFITKLNSLTGERFRMPTEVEWEYAARGGKKSKGYTYSGSDTVGEVAWYDGNSSSKTHAVKTKAANELGIYDMSGNVWEWCSDWDDTYSSSAQTDPAGPTTGANRVNRGGSWFSNAANCRCASRTDDAPSIRGGNLGVRLAL